MVFVLNQGHQYLIHVKSLQKGVKYRSLRYWTCAFIWFPLSNLLNKEKHSIAVGKLLFYRLCRNLKVPLVEELMLKAYLQPTLSQYALNAVLLLLLPGFPQDQIHTHTLWRPRATLMKALGKAQPSFLCTHTCTEHKANLLPVLSPFPTHHMTITYTRSHQHTASISALPNGRGSTGIPVSGHIVWEHNSSGSE